LTKPDQQYQQYSEEQLVLMLRKRQQEGVGVLYDRYSGALFGVVNKMVQSTEVAEDILQEAFVKIWENIDAYDATKGKLFTWMLNVTRNLALDKIRSKNYRNVQKNYTGDNMSVVVDQEQHDEINPDTIGVKDMMGKLKAEHRQLIEMMYFQGYTQSEIAEELNMPLGSVKTKIRAAMMQLREMFISLVIALLTSFVIK
jgi:RNA polymerase sigma-70 factor, ECF subfamily